jgi:hypothetical protein
MDWGAELFYGVCTAVAFGLSWKRGGSIAIAGTLVAAMWLFQGMIYWSGQTFMGNLMGSMISALLLMLISRLKLEPALYVVMAALASQLYLHVTFRLHGPYVVPFYLAINVLYVVQLIALGWSGGKLVLDELGSWMADLWIRWRVVGMAWAQEACSYFGLLFHTTARYYLGGIYVGSDRDLWGA